MVADSGNMYDSPYYKSFIKETFGNRKNWNKFEAISMLKLYKWYTSQLFHCRL
jgi:hypothetical protein